MVLAKRLHRYPVNGKRRLLRDVSKALAEAGYVARSGKPFDAKSIARMVESAVRPSRAKAPSLGIHRIKKKRPTRERFERCRPVGAE